MTTDRIEKKIVLRASPARVWRAVSDAREFGAWFGVALEGDLAEGAHVRGRITTPGYEHVVLDLWIERLEPEHRLAYRWHPHDVDPAASLADEPTTLVELTLRAVPDGTELTVVESGFDRLPAARRDLAFRENSQGWVEQLQNVARHVAA